PANQIQFQLGRLQNMLATFPTVDYKDAGIEIKDVTAVPILYVSTTAKRTLDDVADATNKAMDQLQAAIRKDKLSATGPRRTITTNWGDENYDFDVAVPVDQAPAATTDPVKSGEGYGGKALVTSFTGSPAQLPLMRLMLKAYAYTHGYLFDESSQGNGRFYDEKTTTDPNAADDQQSFSVYLPVQIQ
ncbi:MAG: GyrI-like domain-containing protein, partial [Proteobacteria bacterium]|nr:GyrI-like domain-containing protein [Pseudomonadota bacterium]